MLTLFNEEPRTVSSQIVLTLLLVVLVTAAITWLPEILLVRRQIERQTWAQLEQGRRAAGALYRSREADMVNLAESVSQLPRVRELSEQRSWETLSTYLRPVRANLELDLLQLCAPGLGAVASADMTLEQMCDEHVDTGYHLVHFDQPDQAEQGEPGNRVRQVAWPEVWLIAVRTAHYLGGGPGRLVVGVAVDDQFLMRLQAETRLEHTVVVEGIAVASSFEPSPEISRGERTSGEEPMPWRPFMSDQGGVEISGSRAFLRNNIPYYAAQIEISDVIRDEVALDVSAMHRAEQQAIQSQAVSLVLVLAIGALLALMLGRRIGQPLSRLAQAAGRLREGELDTPIDTHSSVSEVVLLTDTLERARQQLNETLGDLQQEKEWVDHLLEAIVEGIVALDRAGQITFWSPGAVRMTGWQAREVLGRDCDEILQPVDIDLSFTELIPKPGQQRRVVLYMADRSESVFSVTRAHMTPIGEQEAHMALVFRDVSEEEAVQRLLGHFMANMTHEFRTPLSALAAATEMLEDELLSANGQAVDGGTGSRAQTAPGVRTLLTSINTGIFGLQTLVDNLLESASLEAGTFKVSTRPVQLSQIIQQAVDAIYPLLRKRKQRLVLESPTVLPPVLVDPRRTSQVLTNLLSNASKYGPSGADITLRIKTESADGANVLRVEVIDQGEGISVSDGSLLFGRFVHFGDGDDKPSRYGTGIGLWVVKMIVEAQNGEVGGYNQDDGGAIFWFTVPVASQ